MIFQLTLLQSDVVECYTVHLTCTEEWDSVRASIVCVCVCSVHPSLFPDLFVCWVCLSLSIPVYLFVHLPVSLSLFLLHFFSVSLPFCQSVSWSPYLCVSVCLWCFFNGVDFHFCGGQRQARVEGGVGAGPTAGGAVLTSDPVKAGNVPRWIGSRFFFLIHRLALLSHCLH